MRSEIEEFIGKGAAAEIYKELLGDLNYAQPHEFIGNAYGKYKDNCPSNPSVNGRIFEYLICETLARENVTPFYYQVKFTQVPDADFDIVLYHERFPVVLTAKTSLRERYKQAVLEAKALRDVYPAAESHLVTLSDDEADGVNSKIKARYISGLDSCVVASREDYSRLLRELKRREHPFTRATPVCPIQGEERAYPASSA